MLLHSKERYDRNEIYSSNLVDFVKSVNDLDNLYYKAYGSKEYGVTPILRIIDSASLVYLAYNHMADIESGTIDRNRESLYSENDLPGHIENLRIQIEEVFNIDESSNKYSFKHYPWYKTGMAEISGANVLLSDISLEAGKILNNIKLNRKSTPGLRGPEESLTPPPPPPTSQTSKNKPKW